MTPADRAALNRQAATLAGYTFTLLADGEQVTDPEGVHWGWLPAGVAGPDFVGDARLWWPLVEGMAREIAAAGGYWLGPVYDAAGEWHVKVGLKGQSWQFAAESPGECAVRGALAVAAALARE